MAKNNNTKYAIRAIKTARKFQQDTKKNQHTMLEANLLASEEAEDVTFDNVNKYLGVILSQLAKLQGPIWQKTEAGGYQHILPYELRFNKGIEIVKLLQGQETEFWTKIATGTMPKGFDNDIGTTLPDLDNGGKEFWGSSQVSTLNAGLFLTNMWLNKKENLGEVDTSSLGTTMIYDINIEDQAFAKAANLAGANSFMTTTEDSFIWHNIHAGYSFGGCRKFDADSYDCTSWIESMYGLKSKHPELTATTADFFAAYTKQKLDGEYTGKMVEIQSNWQKSPSGHLSELMVATDEPSVGDAWVLRKLKGTEVDFESLGSGGHATVIIGFDKEGNPVGVSANRDMPHMEGIGTQTRAKTGYVDGQWFKHVMYFEPQMPCVEKFEVGYAGLDDLPTVIKWVDSEYEM